MTPGRGLTIVDHLTGETRDVHEVSGSRTLRQRDSILARVVQSDGISLFCGMHPRSLAPADAALVLEALRKRLRRKKAVPVERLRPTAIGRFMIELWEDAVNEADLRRSLPPRLQNTDGEPLVFTTDHFRFAPEDAKAIEQRLATMDGVNPPEAGDPTRAYVFERPGNAMQRHLDNTIVAKLTLQHDRLELETNSVERANAMREQLHRALGRLIEFKGREHVDPLSAKAPRGKSESTPEPTLEEQQAMAEALRSFKAQQYAHWPDEPLPALGGRTARQAVRSKQGREQVDLLLKTMEYHEAGLPEEQRYDFGVLRRELGV